MAQKQNNVYEIHLVHVCLKLWSKNVKFGKKNLTEKHRIDRKRTTKEIIRGSSKFLKVNKCRQKSQNLVLSHSLVSKSGVFQVNRSDHRRKPIQGHVHIASDIVDDG